MQLQVAQASGFCYGVRRAIQLAEESMQQGTLYALGPLVHNPQELARLQEQGMVVVDDIDEVSTGATVLIRAHGASPDVYDIARARQLQIIDATCPHVATLLRKSREFVEDGYQLLILGDVGHPEVQAALAWAGPSATVIAGPGDIPKLVGRVGLVAQTTTKLEVWDAVVKTLQAENIELKVGQTICHATAERQKAAQELSKQVDIMVVVGGHNSANTRNLVQLCSDRTPTHHVETAAEIDPAWFHAGDKIGITAGASTPDWIIKEVVTTVENMEKKNTEIIEEAAQEEAEAAQTEEECATQTSETEEVEPAAEAASDQAVEEESEQPAEEEEVPAMPSPNEIVDDMADIRTGQIVEGTVVRVTDSEVYVDIRYKSDGVIVASELSNLPNTQPSDVVAEGDTIKAVVLRLENKEGNVVLSKRRADQEEGWKKAEAAFASEEPVTGQVTEVVKGGLIVNLYDLRAFLPASLVDLRYVPDLSIYVGQEIEMKIIEMESNRRRLVVSRKAVLEEKLVAQREATWASLEEGQTIEGVVQRLVDFGAFVDVGGVDGLVHVSEISWGRVNHPSEVLSEGEKISVKVLGVDRERERISLSLKQTQPDPWTLVTEQFKVGEIVQGKVMRTVSFGAFVELTPGVEGLVHISQLSNERVEKTEDVVQAGDVIDVHILSINPTERRISLSMRDPSEPRQSRSHGDRSERRNRRDQRSHSYREEGAVTLGDVFGDLFDDKEKKEDKEEQK